MRNLGKVSMQMLASIQIKNEDDLNAFGVSEAYIILKQNYAKVNLNLLWSLQAAIDDIDWRLLSEEKRTLY